MKRLIYRSINYPTELLELDVYIELKENYVEASSILDINDPAFKDFEINVLSACELHDFELEDSYASDNKDSISQYYIYVKTNRDGTKLKVLLKIRVSDHVLDDRKLNGKLVTYNKRDLKYMNDQAKEYASKHFNQSRGYRARHLNIVFNDDLFTSYEDALRAIEESLDDFDK